MKLRALVRALGLALVATATAACSSSSAPAPRAIGPLAVPAFGAPATAGAPAAMAPAASGFDAADARAFYQAFVFSLQQVGRADVAAQVAERDVAAALSRAYPSASAEVRAALDTASDTWPRLQAAWPTMSLEQRRELVYGVLAIGLGEQAAGQLVGVTTPPQRGGRGGGVVRGGGSSFDVNVDYEGSSCWGSAGCTGYESSGDGTGSYTFEEPSIPMD